MFRSRSLESLYAQGIPIEAAAINYMKAFFFLCSIDLLHHQAIKPKGYAKHRQVSVHLDN